MKKAAAAAANAIKPAEAAANAIAEGAALGSRIVGHSVTLQKKVWSLLFSVVQNALRMKGFTIVLVGFDLLLVNMILSGALKPGSDLVGWVGLLRVPAIICLIIGFIRLARENRQRKSS